ncbi:flavin reductase family protein [Streptomyces collinus]|uniref:flavin reductase family protein n=1 Tax=Streptomyces collinus TaxID=42684 RepID=UPI0034406A24
MFHPHTALDSLTLRGRREPGEVFQCRDGVDGLAARPGRARRPPLVVFYSGRTSASAVAIVRSGRFCVHVPAEDQHQGCAAFTGPPGPGLRRPRTHPRLRLVGQLRR